MRLAGLDLTDDCTLELVTRLRRADFSHQADTIEGALVSGQAEVSLTIPLRVAILTVLDDPPPRLAQLRGALLERTPMAPARGDGLKPRESDDTYQSRVAPSAGRHMHVPRHLARPGWGVRAQRAEPLLDVLGGAQISGIPRPGEGVPNGGRASQVRRLPPMTVTRDTQS